MLMGVSSFWLHDIFVLRSANQRVLCPLLPARPPAPAAAPTRPPQHYATAHARHTPGARAVTVPLPCSRSRAAIKIGECQHRLRGLGTAPLLLRFRRRALRGVPRCVQRDAAARARSFRHALWVRAANAALFFALLPLIFIHAWRPVEPWEEPRPLAHARSNVPSVLCGSLAPPLHAHGRRLAIADDSAPCFFPCCSPACFSGRTRLTTCREPARAGCFSAPSWWPVLTGGLMGWTGDRTRGASGREGESGLEVERAIRQVRV